MNLIIQAIKVCTIAQICKKKYLYILLFRLVVDNKTITMIVYSHVDEWVCVTLVFMLEPLNFIAIMFLLFMDLWIEQSSSTSVCCTGVDSIFTGVHKRKEVAPSGV